MKCPICKSELVKWVSMPLQSFDEHICSPDKTPTLKQSYCCSSFVCPSFVENTINPIIVWTIDGEMFCMDYHKARNLKFIDNNNAPFGTYQRKINVEIYKKDENKLLFTFPCYPLKGWKVYSKWYYKSNEDGKILQRKLSFEIFTNKGVYYINGLRMLKFSLSRIYNYWKDAKKSKKNDWNIHNLQEKAKMNSSMRNEWWRKVSAFAARLALKNLGIQPSA